MFLGLEVVLFTLNKDGMRIPPLLAIIPVIFMFSVIATKRGRDKTSVLLSSTLVVVLSAPYFLLALEGLRDYIKSGKIYSIFINNLTVGGNEGTLVVYSFLVFGAFLSSLFLSRILVEYFLPTLEVDGGVNPIKLMAHFSRVKSWSLFGFLAGLIPPLLFPTSLNEVLTLTYMMVSPLPIQFSLITVEIMTYLGLGQLLGFPELLLAVLIFSLFRVRQSGRKLSDGSSNLLLFASSLLLTVLLFFILFGASFPSYAVFYILAILALTLIILNSEGRGFLLAPFLLTGIVSVISQVNIGGTEQFLSPIAPIIFASIPAVLVNLYNSLLNTKDKEDNEECSYNKILILSLGSAPVAYLMYALNGSIFQLNLSSPLQQVTLNGTLVALVALIVTMSQEKLGRVFFERGSNLFIPLSFTALHPVGLLLGKIFITGLPVDKLPIVLLASLLILSVKVLSYLKHLSMSDFNLMLFLGTGMSLFLLAF